MESTAVCSRCGYCCKGHIALVPKTITADLSPEYIEKLAEEQGGPAAIQYVEENTQPQGDRCPWLVIGEDGLAHCYVYSHRSSCCRNYPDSDVCRIGDAFKEKRLKDSGTEPTIAFSAQEGKPILELFMESGDIRVHGRLVTNDMEVVQGLRDFLNEYNTRRG
jgi:Fe-S-cluster containining protein